MTLAPWKRIKHARRLAALRERRAEAYEAVKAAQARGDTRAVHDAIERLAKATHAVMREELRE